MAITTRYAGSAYGVNNVDANTTTGNIIVATGLTKNPTILKVSLGNSQTFTDAELDTGGAVETILRQIGVDSTVVMYQVTTSTNQIAVLAEAIGSDAATIQTRIQSLAANIGIAGNIYAGPGLTVTNSGFRLF